MHHARVGADARQRHAHDRRVTYSDFVSSDGEIKSDGSWQRLMESVKTQIGTHSSASQLDMIKLQAMINKANQAVEMMNNLVQKFAATRDKIIANMR